MNEPPTRGQQLLEQMIREQMAIRNEIRQQKEDTLGMLHNIYKQVTTIAIVVLVAFALQFIGCPAMDAARNTRYQSPDHLVIPSQLLPP
jgi:hypothetical protein